jgi:uncharacterized protein YbjT (DUF2867 family)
MSASDRLDVLMTGASGLVGQGVLRACLASPHVERVTALVRRTGSAADGVREIVLPDFLQADAIGDQFAGFDACFYCAGAPPIGTPEPEYRAVTLEATLAVARAWAAANPQGRFFYVSGAHADPDSVFMPLRIKGETERALASLPIRTVMLRPGGVRPVAGTGTRHGLLKPLYLLGGPLMTLATRATPSLMTSNDTLGRAMIELARTPHPPAVVECADINRLGR